MPWRPRQAARNQSDRGLKEARSRRNKQDSGEQGRQGRKSNKSTNPRSVRMRSPSTKHSPKAKHNHPKGYPEPALQDKYDATKAFISLRGTMLDHGNKVVVQDIFLIGLKLEHSQNS